METTKQQPDRLEATLNREMRKAAARFHMQMAMNLMEADGKSVQEAYAVSAKAASALPVRKRAKQVFDPFDRDRARAPAPAKKSL